MLVVVPLIPTADAATTVLISITTTLSEPDITIPPGTTVTWTNNDQERHRIRSESGPEDFDSGNLEPGASFSVTLNTEGTYSYLDDRDDQNAAYFGTITVSSSAPGEEPPPSSGEVTVDVVDRAYRPPSISVAVGSTVTWKNMDDRPHTVTERNGGFDSGVFDTGGTYSRTFAAEGTYNYFCTLHPDMVASVTVTATGTEPPPPPPPPPPPEQPPPSEPPPPPPGDVTIFDNGFTPASLTLEVGQSVTWTNTGSLPHTVTDAAARFDSGLLLAGEAYSRTFANPGTFNYLCTIHPEMTATVVVADPGSEPPPPPPPAEPPEEPPPTNPDPGDITIFDNGFTPGTVTVREGTRISWANTGALPHTVTDRAGRFNSGLLGSGESYGHTFSAAGTYDYYCTLHPEMTATVLVVGSDGSPPPDAPPPVDTTPPDVPPNRPGVSDITIFDNGYSPRNITVAAGSTLTFHNTGLLPHTVTADDGAFDSGLLMTSGTYRKTFPAEGTYDYYCTIHPEMNGSITVTAGGSVVGAEDGALDGQVTGAAPEQLPQIAGTEPADSGQTVVVDVIDLDYDPDPVEIEVGTTVVWTNVGDLPHTVTRTGDFDSGLMPPDAVFRHAFTEAGVYDYLCTLHPGMEGSVIVTELSGSSLSPVNVDATGPPIANGSTSEMNSAFKGIMIAGVGAVALGLLYSLGFVITVSRRDPVI